MKKIVQLLVILIFCSFSNTKAQNVDFDYNQISKISDSIKVQNIIIHNLFKSQIIAHKNNEFDSKMIVSNVYLLHKKLWDSCYGKIFGDENANRFNNEEGMIKWNQTIFDKNKSEYIERTKTISKININKLFKKKS